MFINIIDQHISLKPTEIGDAEPLFNLVDANREHLHPWMPWVDATKTVADERHFIESMLTKQARGEVFITTIIVDGEVAGMLDIHNIDQANHRGEIGYWLGKAFVGQGVMTKSLERLEEIAFTELELHKLQLDADVDNPASRAVAERRQYHLDATLPEHAFINGHYVDEVIYSLTVDEWSQRQDD
ncbi:GNAT family N-acetyltransferase [Lactiplantibacillus mudanjiangensis]|uniref:Ribosomal protein acetylating enzyme [Lactobacillus plantarum JDM1] n=1 Tax=Lactiplantibacillus mudanjiangensis TaxID=1296538 RepID=A0A660EA52_9LACO|nr:GNAT family protein [Lactiplantibacillus mudanjiangensis]VDG19151.1 ribosomal protein acetylating enzyme [Lactobacillus plantarum JDM1] [Lactiplantibacillus mudanjiangensis]VDG25683.1 ribosomal protein acetylating enzyme [Lactobacillus plantarum JDM1] [Lactiplantibacillus mudanjiangensis]VDG29920.1 ribosomal protein acetylating enzyme [Lactobacillus plantarum JDM1] [Lactiplantibacillus mudanjiangensis]VDG33222.1 ribosomal protein acetylating enzyme [Lactobacillus plantarum JDM1] [Lactiplanti